jgi:NAD(P)-dependent dehydrogenase (short-subunit alcohol dehydrogenase family)
VQADLTTVEGGETLARTALERLNGVDIIAHVIGGSSTPGGGFVALTDDHWLAELNLNLLATVRLDRLLVPQMIEPAPAWWCTSPPSSRSCLFPRRPPPTPAPRPRSGPTASPSPKNSARRACASTSSHPAGS